MTSEETELIPDYDEVDAPDAEAELPADSFDPAAADFTTEGGCA